MKTYEKVRFYSAPWWETLLFNPNNSCPSSVATCVFLFCFLMKFSNYVDKIQTNIKSFSHFFFVWIGFLFAVWVCFFWAVYPSRYTACQLPSTKRPILLWACTDSNTHKPHAYRTQEPGARPTCELLRASEYSCAQDERTSRRGAECCVWVPRGQTQINFGTHSATRPISSPNRFRPNPPRVPRQFCRPTNYRHWLVDVPTWSRLRLTSYHHYHIFPPFHIPCCNHQIAAVPDTIWPALYRCRFAATSPPRRRQPATILYI